MNSKEEMKAPEGQDSRFRQYQGPMAILTKVLGAGGALFCILYISGVFFYFKFYLQSLQYNAIFMGLVLTLTFLLVPARKGAPRNRLPWYDLLLILGGLAGSVYINANALELSYFGKISATPLEIALGSITMVVLIEAVRRTFGWAMVAVSVAFLLYAKFGYLLSGPLSVYYSDWSTLTADVYLSSQGIFGSLTSISSGIILAFMVFGVFFVTAGGGDFFLKFALASTGTMRGGPAKAAIVGSALFGTLSGSPTANVVVTGTVTIPLMKSIGYKPHYAGAIEAIASTGGAITPPIMAGIGFLMAQLVGVPYAKIAIIATLPAFLYFLSLFVQAHLQAVKEGITGLPRDQLPSLKATIKGGWELTIPFVVLVVLLFGLNWPAVTAAIYTIVSLIFISMFRKQHRITLKRFIDSLEDGLRVTLAIANILALAGVILAVLSVTGLGPKLSSALVLFSGGNLVLLVALAGLASYVMGMGISFMASYVLVVVLVAPALQQLGLPVIVTHFFIMYMVMSTNFTPPYCTAAFVAAPIAGAHPFRIGFQAMRLGIVTFLVPFVIVFNPALILIGTPGDIVLAAVTAIIGIVGLSAGIEGYLFSGMNWPQRVLFIIGGVAMFMPGLVTDMIGIGILALAVLWQWGTMKRQPLTAKAS